MNKTLTLFVFFFVLSCIAAAENLILKEFKDIPAIPGYQLKSTQNEVKNIYLYRDSEDKYHLEIFFLSGSKVFRDEIVLDKNTAEKLLSTGSVKWSGELDWEKEIDRSFIVYGASLNGLSATSMMAASFDIREEYRNIGIAVLTLGTYLHVNNLAGKNYFTKRDLTWMSSLSTAATLETSLLMQNINNLDNNSRIRITALTFFGSFWLGKLAADNMDLTLTSAQYSLRLGLTTTLYAGYMAGEWGMDEQAVLNLAKTVFPLSYAAGGYISNNGNWSTGASSLCGVYSDTAAAIANQISDEPKTRATLTYAASIVPYLFADSIEKKIYFKEGDQISILVGEAIGCLIGSSTAALVKADEKWSPILTATGAAAVNTYNLLNMLETRKQDEQKITKTNDAFNIEVNPSVLIYPLAKINGGGEFLRVAF